METKKKPYSPWIIDILIDVSESMDQPFLKGISRLDMAIDLLTNNIIPNLNFTDFVGVKIFGERVSDTGVQTLLTPRRTTPSELEPVVKKLPVGTGKTPLAEALQQSILELNESPGSKKKILLFSDGSSNGELSLDVPLKLASDLNIKIHDKMMIYPVCFSNDPDDGFERISKETNAVNAKIYPNSDGVIEGLDDLTEVTYDIHYKNIYRELKTFVKKRERKLSNSIESTKQDIDQRMTTILESQRSDWIASQQEQNQQWNASQPRRDKAINILKDRYTDLSKKIEGLYTTVAVAKEETKNLIQFTAAIAAVTIPLIMTAVYTHTSLSERIATLKAKQENSNKVANDLQKELDRMKGINDEIEALLHQEEQK